MPEWTLPPLPLVTERLALRLLDPRTDVDAVYAYQSRADVCRYIPYEPRTREEVAALVAKPERQRRQLVADREVINLAAVLRESGTLIGDVVMIAASIEHSTLEIGYAFHPRYGGQGYASEAALELLRVAFEEFGVRRVTARIDARNDRSAALLRRIGMRQEALLLENEWFKGRWGDEIDFAMLAREWPPAGPA